MVFGFTMYLYIADKALDSRHPNTEGKSAEDVSPALCNSFQHTENFGHPTWPRSTRLNFHWFRMTPYKFFRPLTQYVSSTVTLLCWWNSWFGCSSAKGWCWQGCGDMVYIAAQHEMSLHLHPLFCWQTLLFQILSSQPIKIKVLLPKNLLSLPWDCSLKQWRTIFSTCHCFPLGTERKSIMF